MSTDVHIAAESRADFGKGASRRYRRDGRVPAVMYGSGSQLRHVTLPSHELNLALRIPRVVLDVSIDGSQLLVAPRDVQRDPLRLDLLHIDLILLTDADVAARHAYAEALEKAESKAEEAGFEPHAAAALLEEAASNEEDINAVAENIVELLEEQQKALRAAAAVAAAREEAAEAAEAEGAAAGEGEEESAAEDSDSE
ncbi:MAG: 50S ribosomal protein L25 [Actinomycetia bacterium]|nr:50S ribosomal protein L25 [Actinomycetes bacterium]